MVTTKDLMGDTNEKVELTGSASIGHETLTVPSTVTSFSERPPRAAGAIITTEIADVRYWVDGAIPTTLEGHLVKAGGSIELNSASQLVNFKAVTTSGTAILQISYF